MNSYKDITFWENKRRLEKLYQFRNFVEEYFDDIRNDPIGLDIIEGEKAKRYRREINYMVDEVNRIIIEAGINPGVFYSSSLNIGGYDQYVDVFSNLYNLQKFDISHQDAVTFIERAIGIYQSDKRVSMYRTFNPFWWIQRILYWFARIPLRTIGAVGFDTTGLENNILGRLLKAFFGSIPILAAILTILYYMGWLDHLRFAIGIVD